MNNVLEFRDLKKQYSALKDDIDAAISAVCSSAHFISGSSVKELEDTLADYVGVKYCISCANGTDAITLALMAWGVGEGDAVFVPDFTFFSSGECPACEGATCIFVDVDKKTYNIDCEKLEDKIKKVIDDGTLNPKVVIAVDLFGQPADYIQLKELCSKYDLLLLEDCAQGFGGNIEGKMACSFGDISTTSFFPAKPLGCYGDGGAVFTDNDEWAQLIRSYAVHGKSNVSKYDNIRLGMNSRLDTIQAAILQVKFKAFKDYELMQVNSAAEIYTSEFRNRGLDKYIVLPEVKTGFYSSWAQYTIQLPSGINRGKLQMSLKEAGIPSAVYYEKPMHEQQAFKSSEIMKSDCDITNGLCKCVLSLPIHPYITKDDIIRIVSEFANNICLENIDV